MAEDTGQERTEQPTHHRVQEARQKGQVARSRELTTVLILLCTSGYLLLAGGDMTQTLAQGMREHIRLDRALIFDPMRMPKILMDAMFDGLVAISPLLGITLVAALMGPLALGGWSFSAEALSFKWERMDPMQGLKKIFSWRGVIELVKSLVKFALVMTAAVTLVWQLRADVLGLGSEAPRVALVHGGQIMAWSFLAASAALIVIALVDVPFQLWDYKRQLRMTRQEIKDDTKQTEGSPEIRSRIRNTQREMARRRMMAEVPKADVIITNPTHYAVALRYDQKRMRAPVVVAKGADLIAAQIRHVGTAHKVTIVSAPPLARALFYSTDLNREIPAGLYLAMAQVLAYVYQLRRHPGLVPSEPVPMSDLPIPDDLRR